MTESLIPSTVRERCPGCGLHPFTAQCVRCAAAAGTAFTEEPDRFPLSVLFLGLCTTGVGIGLPLAAPGIPALASGALIALGGLVLIGFAIAGLRAHHATWRVVGPDAEAAITVTGDTLQYATGWHDRRQPIDADLASLAEATDADLRDVVSRSVREPDRIEPALAELAALRDGGKGIRALVRIDRVPWAIGLPGADSTPTLRGIDDAQHPGWQPSALPPPDDDAPTSESGRTAARDWIEAHPEWHQWLSRPR